MSVDHSIKYQVSRCTDSHSKSSDILNVGLKDACLLCIMNNKRLVYIYSFF